MTLKIIHPAGLSMALSGVTGYELPAWHLLLSDENSGIYML